MVKIETDVFYDVQTPDEWPEDRRVDLVIDLMSDLRKSLKINVDRAITLFDRAKQYDVWKFINRSSWDDFLDYSGLNEEAIAEYREGLAILKSQGHRGPATAEQVRKARENPLPKHGRPEKGDNVTFTEDRGNSSSYTLRRLARDGRDDLLEAIESEEMSVNQAAIRAGYRRAKVQVPRDDVDGAVRILLRYYSADEIEGAIHRSFSDDE